MLTIPYPPEKNTPQVFPLKIIIPSKTKRSQTVGDSRSSENHHPFFHRGTASDPPKKIDRSMSRMGILQSIAEYDPGVKILLYVAIFIVEKLLLDGSDCSLFFLHVSSCFLCSFFLGESEWNPRGF